MRRRLVCLIPLLPAALFACTGGSGGGVLDGKSTDAPAHDSAKTDVQSGPTDSGADDGGPLAVDSDSVSEDGASPDAVGTRSGDSDTGTTDTAHDAWLQDISLEVDAPDSEDGAGGDADSLPWRWPCSQDEHCETPDPCTTGACVDGYCEEVPLACEPHPNGCPNPCHPIQGCDHHYYIIPGTTCAILGNPCFDRGECTSASICGFPPTPICDDGNPCTENPLCIMAGGVGCTNPKLPDGAPCDDHNPCTTEACVDGQCTAMSNACPCDETNDQCESLHGDGDACNGVLVCGEVAGAPGCVTKPGSIVSCDPNHDGTGCAQNECNPTTGQCELVPVQAGASCDDGDACTVGDICDGQGGCSGMPGMCDDGKPCTKDTCWYGECIWDDLLCDDGNPWTVDACTGTGCTHTPRPDNPFSCTSDADCPASSCCTSVCDPSSHTCMPGGAPESCCCTAAADCDDGDPCTLDTCTTGMLTTTPATCCGGCDHAPIPGCCATDAACDDKDPCTADTCQDGKCAHAFDAALCLSPECLAAEDAYKQAVGDSKACGSHDDCKGTVPASLLCGCSTIVASGGVAAVGEKQTTFEALGCPAALTCAPCQETPKKAAFCVGGTCKTTADLSCKEAGAELSALVSTFESQTKGMACEVNADCQQCYRTVTPSQALAYGYVHKSLSLTAYDLLVDEVMSACCCSGDDFCAEAWGPCCVDGTCTYDSTCPATCPIACMDGG